MELWVQPGFQQDMTVEEFEDAINEAIEGNTERANEQFSKMADEFLAQFAPSPLHRDGPASGRRPTVRRLVQTQRKETMTHGSR
jgi:hypothetical protein